MSQVTKIKFWLVPLLMAATVEHGFAALEEVMVTAERRPASLQQVPLSLININTDDLHVVSLTNLDDLRHQVPNLQAIPHPNSVGTLLLFMRGVGNSDEQVIQDPSVAVYLDGIYLPRSQGLTTEITDLERVEVLRGPQGTLYGRNAAGGAINFISRAPSLEGWEFDQRLLVGNRSQRQSTTRVNVPLGDQFAVRVAASKSLADGFVRHLGYGASRFGDRDRSAWRTDALWEPSERVSLRYVIDDGRSSDTPAFIDQVPLAPAGGNRPKRGGSAMSQLPSNSVVSRGQALTVEWLPGAHSTLRSLSAYRELSDRQNQIFHAGLLSAQPVLMTQAEGRQIQWSQELQWLHESPDRGIEYLLGAYWFEENIERDAVNATPFNQQRRSVMGRDIRNTATALFAQLTWQPERFSERLTLSLGNRWSRDERRATVYRSLGDLLTGEVRSIAAPSVGERDFSNHSASLSATWQLGDSADLYLRFAEGYKSGGFNARASSPSRFSEGFDDEELDMIEWGLKSEWLERRLRANLALFHTEYEDIQVNVQSDPNDIVVSDVLNAGKATVRGLELDSEAMIGERWRLQLRYAWLDATFDTVRDAAGTNVADVYRLVGAPRHFIALNARHLFPEVASGRLYADLSFQWQDDQYHNSTISAGRYIVQAYGLVAARLTWEKTYSLGAVDISLWGKNLTDREYYASHFNGGVGQAIPSAIWGEPRSFGMEFSYHF